jgi:hypothetical protein
VRKDQAVSLAPARPKLYNSLDFADSAYGLRTAGAALAAESGATERQLMAIFGWTTIKETSRYTRAARQKVLAASQMKLLSREGVRPEREAGGHTILESTATLEDFSMWAAA